MKLPIFHTGDKDFLQLQTRWAAIINPYLSEAFLNGQLLTKVALVTGSNTISHKLGRPLQGWVPVRIRASATFYDTQDTNTTPEITLQLHSSANVTVDLYVF